MDWTSAWQELIIELKKKGIKTEPAFAMLLDLKGDPYDELLKYDKQIQWNVSHDKWIFKPF